MHTYYSQNYASIIIYQPLVLDNIFGCLTLHSNIQILRMCTTTMGDDIITLMLVLICLQGEMTYIIIYRWIINGRGHIINLFVVN